MLTFKEGSKLWSGVIIAKGIRNSVIYLRCYRSYTNAIINKESYHLLESFLSLMFVFISKKTVYLMSVTNCEQAVHLLYDVTIIWVESDLLRYFRLD